MKVLLVGGGAREHALAWKFARDDPSLDLIAAPGNPGIATLGRCLPKAGSSPEALLDLARSERVDLTVVGPEAPLAAGIVDRFRADKQVIFGPTAAAAEIESSKVFAKQLMIDAGVPTALAVSHTDAEHAKRAIRSVGAPVVIKASGLAAGKGVFVCASTAEANDAVEAMLRDGLLGEAGAAVLVEEYMQGEELSILALTDGVAVLPMLPAQDHKRLLVRDEGPNTGGMGAYAPISIGNESVMNYAVEKIFLPVLDALRRLGRPFTGLLYGGLMLTPQGLKVVEFNCRFGDPETEALLPLLESNLLEIATKIAVGERISEIVLSWQRRYSVATVLASQGYPNAPKRGAAITLPEIREDVHLFHAGTSLSGDGRLVAAGGRVLAVTAVADSLERAQSESLRAAADIHFEGKQFRTDIGWRELERNARASRN
ncbi:MAG: phosphoribosylamine--glycine ligase [Gemmatimonadaceae bacterium]